MANKTIKVKSGLKDNRIALWERHPAHPGGEVSIHGDKVVEVAETSRVKSALKDGRLVEAEKAVAAKKAAGK